LLDVNQRVVAAFERLASANLRTIALLGQRLAAEGPT
jgi:hypothetical protein